MPPGCPRRGWTKPFPTEQRAGPVAGKPDFGPDPSTEVRVDTEELPYVDEHAVTVEASAAAVWPILATRIDEAFSHGPVATFAGAVGCESRTASGPRPLSEGSTVPGFTVATAEPMRKLVLRGRHRFSSYALTFRLQAVDAHRTRIAAETRAAFPG